jgi:ABC-2 type transport system ATP-binding protein
MTAVRVEHLTKRYGALAAVDDVSFDVPRGQLLAVLGPNGAGKTTTLETLEGFTAPTSGKVVVLGANPRRAGRAWRARVGLVLQSTSLEPTLTVRTVLGQFARLYPAPRPVDEVLEIVDMTEEADVRISALSGGQRRRVDVAIGIAGRPDILFLDEPTTGLDPQARRQAWASVRNLNSAGTTVVLTTHYIEEADQLADRVLVLSGGRIVADTTPAGLRAQGGVTTIRWHLPSTQAASALPAALARYLDPPTRTLIIQSADVTANLRELVQWAGEQVLDLAGIEIGPPTLEEAYLAVTGELTPHEAPRTLTSQEAR